MNPTYLIYNWGYNGYNPLTIRGMSHQVARSTGGSDERPGSTGVSALLWSQKKSLSILVLLQEGGSQFIWNDPKNEYHVVKTIINMPLFLDIYIYIYTWVNFITTSLFSLTIILVSKGNHPQMAEHFRSVNYYNLPRIHS